MAEVSSEKLLTDRIAALEARVRAVSVGGAAIDRLAAFSSGSCTNECTAACTIGCTNGCTGACVADPVLEMETVTARAAAVQPGLDPAAAGVKRYEELRGGRPG